MLPEPALQAGLKPGKDGSTPPMDAGRRRAELRKELREFIFERLRSYYAERGFDAQSFEAVLAVAPASLADFDRRLHAVADFSRRPEAANLAAANKRVANLLRKQAEESGAPVGGRIDADRFELPAEHALAEALEAADRETRGAWERRDYGRVLERLAQLQQPVDAFFDTVLVNAEDPAIRANRLALLAHLKSQFSAVADIALL
jgi:glycyl-tRNA synthetase beta chain